MKDKTRRKIMPWVFLLPFLVVFLTFMAYPVFYSIYVSFTNFRAGTYTFVGLANFKFIFQDPKFRQALLNTFTILIIQVPLQTFLCVVLANFLNFGRLKLKGLFRMFSFMPVLADAVSYSVVFALFFSNDGTALANSIVGLFGAGPIEWMNEAWPARIVIILATTWRWTGYNAVIILGGLQNISGDLYEAASIDGASPVRQFFSITLPSIRPVILFSVVLSITGTLQLFTEPNLITRGGPIGATTTIVKYLYDVGFTSGSYGVASAGAYVLAVMIAVITFIQMRITRERD